MKNNKGSKCMTKNEIENFRLYTSDDLVQLVAELGYDTAPQQLQCNNGAHVSVLLHFFNDNPGAMEELQEWILNNSDLEEDVSRHLSILNFSLAHSI